MKKKVKVNKNYVIGFLIDYGPPTFLSICWGFYAVYQQTDDPFWEVFGKNFVPAFFVLNWLAMRVHRTKKSVDNKERFKNLFDRISAVEKSLERIEKKIDNKK